MGLMPLTGIVLMVLTADSNEALYNKKCEDGANVECKIFARQRNIRWLNGINPGKGKPSKISSKVNKVMMPMKLAIILKLKRLKLLIKSHYQPEFFYPKR